MAKLVVDKKTGKKRKVDPARSKAATKAGTKRKGKKLAPSTRRKISKGVEKAVKSGKTAEGRRTVKKTSSALGKKIKKTEKIEKKVHKLEGKKTKRTIRADKGKRRGPYGLKMPSMAAEPKVKKAKTSKVGAKIKHTIKEEKKVGKIEGKKIRQTRSDKGKTRKPYKTRKSAAKAVKPVAKKVSKKAKPMAKKTTSKKVVRHAMKVTKKRK